MSVLDITQDPTVLDMQDTSTDVSDGGLLDISDDTQVLDIGNPKDND